MTVIRAPLNAQLLGDLDDLLGRLSGGGATSRTSRPSSAPITSSERPMLYRQGRP